MRESIWGYADAVFETAGAEGRAAGLAADLEGLVGLVRSSEDLRSVLSDPGLVPVVRRSVVTELLEGKVSPGAQALVAFTVAADRAPETLGNLQRLAAAARELAAGGSAGPEGRLGPAAAAERLDGYAEAVLGSLADRGELSEVEDELFRFARLVEGSEGLLAALTDRDLPPPRRAGLVSDLLGPRARPATTRLASYAARYGRPRDILGTLDWLVTRVAAEENRRVADVRSAVELAADQRERLGHALSRIAGRRVDVRVSVDPALLGGFVASIGDTVIDGSARHRLELMRERISSAHRELTTGTEESL